MLEVAGRHRMVGLEGFRLITPQQNWQRFWTIEFPTFAGARDWIEKEAPPYGRYGFTSISCRLAGAGTSSTHG